MAYDALHKGYYGVNYRTLIGLHRTSSGSSAHVVSPNDPAWDFYIGPLPFLLFNSKERPYMRQTTPARRDRQDQSRDPGDNALDSATWLRSQTSWHMGSGQMSAEPLTVDPDVARFRFYESGGVDPWTPGQLSLLNDTTQRDTGVRKILGIPGVGLLASTNTAGVRKYPSSGSSTQLSTKTVTKIAANETVWFALSTSGLEYGLLAGGGEGAQALSNASAIHWGKDRLWLGAGAALYEVTASPWTIGTAHHTFNSGTIVDIDTSASTLYVMTTGAYTTIYAVTSQDDGTLNVPREVTTLPRGETGNFLYGYLGKYLVIGTDKGIRIADTSDPSSLPLGPLTEVAGGVDDAVGHGDYIWFTAGTQGVKPLPTDNPVPGVYRMDLSAQVASTSIYGDTAAARFAYATDLYNDTASGQPWSVSFYEDDIYFVAGASETNSPMYQQDSTAYVTDGWVESGRISFSTAERKTWNSLGLEVDGAGSIYVTGDTGGGFNAVTQSVVSVPYDGNSDIDNNMHPSSGWFNYRLYLTGDGTAAGSPTLLSSVLRATPAPHRTRYIRIPLNCFDLEQDRNDMPVGYEGFAYDRLLDLEDLEQNGAVIAVIDTRTNESIRCVIDTITYENDSPPDRSYKNFGGVLTVTLLTV